LSGFYKGAAVITTQAEKFVGIDVGKDWLDVGVWGRYEVWQVSNDPAGVEQLLDRLVDLEPELVVLEATAGYEQLAVQELVLSGFSVSVANPTPVRALAKTDVIDARLIAEFAVKMRPVPMQLRNELEFRLRALVSRREQLIEMRTAEINRCGMAHLSMKAVIQEPM
jgi:transposase